MHLTDISSKSLHPLLVKLDCASSTGKTVVISVSGASGVEERI